MKQGRKFKKIICKVCGKIYTALGGSICYGCQMKKLKESKKNDRRN